MAHNTEISWCDDTVNLWWGCTEVHAGCDNCYARTLAHRWGFDLWGKPGTFGGVRRRVKSAFSDLAKFQRIAAATGTTRRVFIGSMMDIFEKPMPVVDNDGQPVQGVPDTHVLRQLLFANIMAGKYPNLIFLLLTKRPSNINKYIPQDWQTEGAPANVWFGCSVVDQKTADDLVKHLLQVNGHLFLSMEPLLGAVDLTRVRAFDNTSERAIPDDPEDQAQYFMNCLTPGSYYQEHFPGDIMPHGVDGPYRPAIDWVIVGGESGLYARAMHPDWATKIVDDCLGWEVPVHFKQWGEWVPVRAAGLYKKMQRIDFSDGTAMLKVGKKAAGRVLNGRYYDAIPEL